MMLERLASIHGSPKKSLGQNFLINQHVVDAIVKKAKNISSESYVEIGPGLGALTEQLKNFDEPLLLLEMDSKFAQFWNEQGLKVTEGDALQFDWESLKDDSICLVSNLPYQISARIVIELSYRSPNIKNMVLMFQKEVAQRVTAEPRTKDYGFLSVVAQAAWETQKVVDVSPQDFYPPPKVMSRVLAFSRAAEVSPGFVQFVKRAFENRRKFMLKNFPEKKDLLICELEQLGFNDKVRAEQLKVTDFQALYKVWVGS